MQRHQYIGNLTKDPEKLSSRAGTEYARFSLAVNTPQGKERRTDYINVLCFKEPLMRFVLNYLRKGSSVWVEGNMLTASTFKKKDGTESTSMSLTANDVQSFGRAGIVGGGDGAGESDAAEPADGGNGSWEPKNYGNPVEDEDLPW